jgi:hypothetical protein
MIAVPEPLLPIGQRAIAIWNFCDGWFPERWPLYAQFHEFGEIALMERLLMVIRNHTREA